MTLPGVQMIAVPPGSNPLETVLRHVETVVDGEGWNALTSLFWLYDEPVGIGVARPPLPETLGRMYPPDLLKLLGRTLGGQALTMKAIGVVLLAEGWGVIADETSAADVAADVAAGRVHTRPDRIELRQATLILVDGRELFLTRIRGREPHVYTRDGVTGTATESLRVFVRRLADAQKSAVLDTQWPRPV